MTTTRLDNATARLLTRLQTAGGRTVTYRRGAPGAPGSDEVQITATPGMSRYQRADDLGLVTEMEVHDELIAAADLVLGEAITEPAEGDQIDVTCSGGEGEITLTYEVMPPGGDEPAWRYMDPGRSALRIHTKLVGSGTT